MTSTIGKPVAEPGRVAAVYAEALAARRYVLSEELPAEHRERVVNVLNRPDLQVLLHGVRIAVADSLSQPFRLQGDDEILVSPGCCLSPAVLAVYLRMALEFRLLRRLCPATRAPFSQRALLVLALHAGLRFIELMRHDEADDLRQNASSWLAVLTDAVMQDALLEQPAEVVIDNLSSCAERLVAAGVASSATSSGLYDRPVQGSALAALLPLACPAEHLLTQGGDDRLQVDPTSGLNGYGCSPKPRPWAITFSSSTASSISDYAYFTVERWRESLLSSGLRGSLEARLGQESQSVREQIHQLLSVDTDYEIVLTSSGTDAELLALWMGIAQARSGHLVNIIVGPAEVGSGTIAAGAGQHFSTETPSGDQVISGETIEGIPGHGIRVEEVSIRKQSGLPLPPGEIQQSIAEIAKQAREKDEGALLHVLDASKTGLEVPDSRTVNQLLDDHASIVGVIVDAAQMRLSRRRLRAYLARGFLVLVTGSKFFTGPPFSGALLIPNGWLEACHGTLEDLPAGFAAYASRADLPAPLAVHARELPPGPNLGLLSRWIAALWEMRALYAVPEQSRRDTIAAFERRLRETIHALANIELLAAPSRPLPHNGHSAAWDCSATIFTYRILKGATASGALTLDEGRLAYRWLNCDISGLLPASAGPEDRQLAATCCHTGQPVVFGHDLGERLAGMRVASGARLISGVCFDPALGDDPVKRLSVELQGLETVLRKAALIGRYWPELNAARQRESTAATEAQA